MNEPYFIEIDDNGCPECHSKRSWMIIGPDGVGLGTSYFDEEDAADLAELVNNAYVTGYNASAQLLREARDLLRHSTCKDGDATHCPGCGLEGAIDSALAGFTPWFTP